MSKNYPLNSTTLIDEVVDRCLLGKLNNKLKNVLVFYEITPQSVEIN